MRRATFALSAGLCIAAACTTLDLDGLSGGGDPAGANDSGLDVVDEKVTDAGVGSDAGAGADASGCARYVDAAFCEDFSRGAASLALTTWSTADTNIPYGTIMITDDAVSAPGAARFDLTNASGGCRSLQLTRTVSAKGSRIRSHISLKELHTGVFMYLGVQVTPTLIYSALTALDSLSVVAFLQKNDSVKLTNVPGGNTMPLTLTPVGRWLELTEEIDTVAHTLTLEVDGQRQSSAIPIEFGPGAPTVSVGPLCSDILRTALVDDVVVWVSP